MADRGFSQGNLVEWKMKNIEEGVEQAADALMETQDREWCEINQAYQIDPAEECWTEDIP